MTTVYNVGLVKCGHIVNKYIFIKPEKCLICPVIYVYIIQTYYVNLYIIKVEMRASTFLHIFVFHSLLMIVSAAGLLELECASSLLDSLDVGGRSAAHGPVEVAAAGAHPRAADTLHDW